VRARRHCRSAGFSGLAACFQPLPWCRPILRFLRCFVTCAIHLLRLHAAVRRTTDCWWRLAAGVSWGWRFCCNGGFRRRRHCQTRDTLYRALSIYSRHHHWRRLPATAPSYHCMVSIAGTGRGKVRGRRTCIYAFRRAEHSRRRTAEADGGGLQALRMCSPPASGGLTPFAIAFLFSFL